MTLSDVSSLDNTGYKEGILLSLLYLGHELELAAMFQTKESLNAALVLAIKETMRSEVSEGDAHNIAIFLTRAFQLNKSGISDLIETIMGFEE